MSTSAKMLIGLQTLFLGRVIGQVLVVLTEPSWLPALEHWQSGLLPYAILLPAQILLLMLMSLVTYDAVRERGYYYATTARTKRILRTIALFYLSAIVLRYVLTMTLVPELRWFGHAIPIFFHVVLASFIFVLSRPASSVRPSQPHNAALTIRKSTDGANRQPTPV